VGAYIACIRGCEPGGARAIQTRAGRREIEQARNSSCAGDGADSEYRDVCGLGFDHALASRTAEMCAEEMMRAAEERLDREVQRSVTAGSVTAGSVTVLGSQPAC
jgi:hypothetical protein